VHFTKLQGLGNDFVLIDARSNEYSWKHLAKSMCLLHFGIGADGLLVLLQSDKADFRMRVFNADGTEAEACGNGLRCFARYLADNFEINKDLFHIETISGIRQAKLIKEYSRELIQVSMGQPAFEPKDIPVETSVTKGKMIDIMLGDWSLELQGLHLKLNFVSMGNPHAICFIDESPASFSLETVGPAITTHSIFPHGANFEIARVINRNKIEMRVWERGAGETLACGSGACATAVAAQLIGFCDEKVEIVLPGGSAYVQWHKGNEVLLTGPAETVFSGEWPE